MSVKQWQVNVQRSSLRTSKQRNKSIPGAGYEHVLFVNSTAFASHLQEILQSGLSEECLEILEIDSDVKAPENQGMATCPAELALILTMTSPTIDVRLYSQYLTSFLMFASIRNLTLAAYIRAHTLSHRNS